jgi:hypothetical protein
MKYITLWCAIALVAAGWLGGAAGLSPIRMGCIMIAIVIYWIYKGFKEDK